MAECLLKTCVQSDAISLTLVGHSINMLLAFSEKT
jgi:hypothetical protein